MPRNYDSDNNNNSYGNNNNVRRHNRRNSANDRHFGDRSFDFGSNKNRNNKKQVRINNEAPQGPVYLQNEWAFWYDSNNAKGLNKEDYENSIIKFGSFKTVQDFWRFYNNINDPQFFPSCSNLRLFKEGIKPLWEDPANVNGGQWTIRTQKNETGKFWIQIVLYIIGEQFTYSNDICGVVLSVRPRSDTINIWNRNADDRRVINSVENQLRKLLKFDANRNIVYKKFDSGLGGSMSDPDLNAMDNRLTMSASDVRIDSKVPLRTTSLDDLSSPSYKSKFESDVSDVSDISDGEAFDLSFESSDNDSELELKSKHKKSSSFSSSPFPNVNSPSWKQHRKSNSDSHKKTSSITPKIQLQSGTHRRQNSDDRTSLQKQKFISNYASLHRELYSNNPEFSPYEIDLSEIQKVNSNNNGNNKGELAKELIMTNGNSLSKSSLSVFLTWTIGGLFLILLWAVFSWQSELFSIAI